MSANDRLAPARLGQTVCLPAAVRRHGTSLLNQQFWLWGQDIRRPEGNLLLQHGFARTRPPEDIQGGRRYALRLDPDRTVVLWGFGLFYGDEERGGLYLSRFRLAPLLCASATPPVGVWTPSQLPPLSDPVGESDWGRARLLLGAALRWVSAYETWVVREMGSDYRQRCLTGCSRPVCPADGGAALWLRMARHCDATLDHAITSDR